MAAAAVVPRFRLTFKQPLQSGKLAKSKEAKRSRPCCKRKATSRRVAVSEETVPKARNAFALFMKQHNTAKKGASKQEFQHEMQRIAKACAKLTQSEKNIYKEKSRSEFIAQRDAMKSHGLPTRRMQNETVPKQQSQLSQLSQLSTQPVEDQDQALLRFGKITVMQGELPVGEGSYGTVLKGLMPYGRFCALKIFMGSKAMISLKQEVLIFNQIKDKLQEGMRQLFPSLLEVECKPQPFPYLALEFAGSSVSQVLIQNGAFTGSAMQRLATQLRSALQALHSIRILHLDLKPANILWVQETSCMKLADFGMSEMMGIEAASIRFDGYVSAPYRPPELWNTSSGDICKHLRPCVDIWSFGCVLFECATASPLMAPLPPARSCNHSVNAWCRSWDGLRQARMMTEPAARRLQARMLRSGPWREHILECLNPDPASRRWSGPTH